MELEIHSNKDVFLKLRLSQINAVRDIHIVEGTEVYKLLISTFKMEKKV